MEEKKCPICEGGKKDYFAKYCDIHNVCGSCGIHRKKANIHWGTRDAAFICGKCEIARRKQRVKERQVNGFDHETVDEITCPYCGDEQKDSWESGDAGSKECPECEEIFDYERNVICTYSTSKVVSTTDHRE